MEILVLFFIDLISLFLDFKFIPKIKIDIFTIIIFFTLYFIFVYKKYYLSSRRKLIIFSALLGIFLGEMQIKEVFFIKKGTLEQMLIVMAVILVIIIFLEFKDLKKHSEITSNSNDRKEKY